MRCFEFFVANSSVSTDGGPYIPDETIMYVIPEDAKELLGPILGRYDQHPEWYFDKLNFGRPPAPWAITCLDQEYSIAGHMAACRQPNSGIKFAPYTQVPNPIPQDFVPQVGVVSMQNKRGLEEVSDKSPLFQMLWEGLKDCTTEQKWLIILDPLPSEWLAQVVPGNSERWLSSSRHRP